MIASLKAAAVLAGPYLIPALLIGGAAGSVIGFGYYHLFANNKERDEKCKLFTEELGLKKKW